MWQGFVTESKKYMSYPDYWPEWGGWTMQDKSIAALKFWRAFPRAWLRFHWFTFADWVQRITGL